MEPKIIVSIEITNLGDWNNLVYARDENEIKAEMSKLEKEIKSELCRSLLDSRSVS